MENLILHPPLGPCMDAKNGFKKIFNALSSLLGPLKVCLFRYFRGVFKNTYTQPKTEKLILHPPLGPWMPSNCLKALY